MTAAYERAGVSRAEIAHLSNLVAAVESADPTVRAVAVDRVDVLAVVAVLDRLVDLSTEVVERAAQRTDAPEPRRGGG